MKPVMRQLSWAGLGLTRTWTLDVVADAELASSALCSVVEVVDAQVYLAVDGPYDIDEVLPRYQYMCIRHHMEAS